MCELNRLHINSRLTMALNTFYLMSENSLLSMGESSRMSSDVARLSMLRFFV